MMLKHKNYLTYALKAVRGNCVMKINKRRVKKTLTDFFSHFNGVKVVIYVTF